MAASDASSLLISAPFGYRHETVQSTRYYFDNAQRGDSPFVILQRTLEGEGRFEWEGEVHPVPPGHLFIAIVPEASAYYYPTEATRAWSFQWLNFYGPMAITLMRDFRATFGPVVPLPENSAAGNLLARLTATLEERRFADPYERSLLCYSLVVEWARLLSAPSGGRSNPVEVAIAVAAARFREPLGVKELAASTGLTREHFTRLFTARTGVSPAAHLRSLRLEAAREMLRTAAAPNLREVAMRCGFPSIRSLRHALEADVG
ncbi:MAG TPA: helix-turn-helix domain-containing protein [Chthoniobacteraceae bacterium]|nr:helix-turn-helix domain-containing protein [Chthoniobacteraceae bacterium]